MREQRIKYLLQEIANEAVPTSLDLWPGIRARLDTAGLAQRNRRLALSCSTLVSALPVPRLRVALAICLAAIVLGAAFVVTQPPALATAGAMLQRFGVLLAHPAAVAKPTQPLSNAAAAEGTPWPEPAAEAVPLPRMSFAEAQRRVPFRIRTPAWLPEGLELRWVHVATEPSASGAETPPTVILSYRPTNAAPGAPSAGLGIEMRRGPQDGGYVIPASAAEEVLVNGRPATYARGAWTHGDRGPVQWDGTADAGMLSWEEGDFTYILRW